MRRTFMKQYGKRIALVILFVVCAVTAAWAISYKNHNQPQDNEIISGFAGDIDIQLRSSIAEVLGNISLIENVNYGQIVNLSAPSIDNHTFLYWLDGNSNKILSNNITFNYRVLSHNPDLRAFYIPQSSTKVIFIDANNNQIKVEQPILNEITGKLEVTAPSADSIPKRPGYEVTGWSQLLTDVTLNLNGIAYLQAIYSRDDEFTSFNITVYGEDPVAYGFDAVATVTAPESNGTDPFSHWIANGQIMSYQRTFQFTVHQDITLTPVYAASVTAIPIVTIDLAYSDYVFPTFNQMTLAGRYEVPAGTDVVEVGIIMQNGDAVETLTLATPNVVKINSSRQNQFGEFAITNLDLSFDFDIQARAYLIHQVGTSFVTTYSPLTVVKETPLQIFELAYHYDFETENTTVITNSYLSADFTSKNLVDNVFNTIEGYSISVNTNETNYPTASRTLVLRPRNDSISFRESWVEFDFGTTNVTKIEFESFYWNAAAINMFETIQFQQNISGTWTNITDIKAILNGSLVINNISISNISGTNFRIYTYGGINNNDARLHIDNFKAFTNPS